MKYFRPGLTNLDEKHPDNGIQNILGFEVLKIKIYIYHSIRLIELIISLERPYLKSYRPSKSQKLILKSSKSQN